MFRGWMFAAVVAAIALLPVSGGAQLTSPLPPGQTRGTATNDSASTGNVGEFQRNALVAATTAAATATVTIATPGVVSFTNSFGTTIPQPVWFTTTGALPTGLSVNTVYWAIPSTITGSTFQLATSVDNAIAGTAINTSGTQSGTHTLNPNALTATATIANVTGMQLTAGDWEVRGLLEYAPAATTTMSMLSCSISTSSAAQGSLLLGGVEHRWMAGTTADASDPRLIQGCGPLRVSIAATTTVYLVSFSRFATSTMNAGGAIIARRAR